MAGFGEGRTGDASGQATENANDNRSDGDNGRSLHLRESHESRDRPSLSVPTRLLDHMVENLLKRSRGL